MGIEFDADGCGDGTQLALTGAILLLQKEFKDYVVRNTPNVLPEVDW